MGEFYLMTRKRLRRQVVEFVDVQGFDDPHVVGTAGKPRRHNLPMCSDDFPFGNPDGDLPGSHCAPHFNFRPISYPVGVILADGVKSTFYPGG